MLALDHPGGDADFAAILRREGKRVLWKCYGSGLREHFGAGVDQANLERALDEILDWVVDAAQHVVAIERALTH
jgi:hypothetical protein